MRVTFDREANAAYTYLLDEIGPGEAVRTFTVDDEEARGVVNLDFDGRGYLVGFEVLNATAALPERLLREAERT